MVKHSTVPKITCYPPMFGYKTDQVEIRSVRLWGKQ